MKLLVLALFALVAAASAVPKKYHFGEFDYMERLRVALTSR